MLYSLVKRSYSKSRKVVLSNLRVNLSSSNEFRGVSSYKAYDFRTYKKPKYGIPGMYKYRIARRRRRTRRVKFSNFSNKLLGVFVKKKEYLSFFLKRRKKRSVGFRGYRLKYDLLRSNNLFTGYYPKKVSFYRNRVALYKGVFSVPDFLHSKCSDGYSYKVVVLSRLSLFIKVNAVGLLLAIFEELSLFPYFISRKSFYTRGLFSFKGRFVLPYVKGLNVSGVVDNSVYFIVGCSYLCLCWVFFILGGTVLCVGNTVALGYFSNWVVRSYFLSYKVSKVRYKNKFFVRYSGILNLLLWYILGKFFNRLTLKQVKKGGRGKSSRRNFSHIVKLPRIVKKGRSSNIVLRVFVNTMGSFCFKNFSKVISESVQGKGALLEESKRMDREFVSFNRFMRAVPVKKLVKIVGL